MISSMLQWSLSGALSHRALRLWGGRCLALGALLALPLSAQGVKVDVPTGLATGVAIPSPLFGVLPFTAKMVRFEEFGTRPLHGPGAVPADCEDCPKMPPISGCDGQPDGAALDAFLDQGIYPYPTRQANEAHVSPWKAAVDLCVREVEHAPIEGRPPGEMWAHQRWEEFYPQEYFQTVGKK